MSVFFALLVLTSWVMFIWISDPDGFREAFARRRAPIPHDPKGDVGRFTSVTAYNSCL